MSEGSRGSIAALKNTDACPGIPTSNKRKVFEGKVFEGLPELGAGKDAIGSILAYTSSSLETQVFLERC